MHTTAFYFILFFLPQLLLTLRTKIDFNYDGEESLLCMSVFIGTVGTYGWMLPSLCYLPFISPDPYQAVSRTEERQSDRQAFLSRLRDVPEPQSESWCVTDIQHCYLHMELKMLQDASPWKKQLERGSPGPGGPTGWCCREGDVAVCLYTIQSNLDRYWEICFEYFLAFHSKVIGLSCDAWCASLQFASGKRSREVLCQLPGLPLTLVWGSVGKVK